MRNAEKDRKDIQVIIASGSPTVPIYHVVSHYLERAVAAEQRVAELEKAMKEIKETVRVTDSSTVFIAVHEVYSLASKLLTNQFESEDRGE